MIEIILTPLEHTRSAERSCFCRAECEIAGQHYEAVKRLGAGNELARLLAAAGIADQPVQVRRAGLAGHLAWPSLHRTALFDYVEGKRTPLRMVRWKPTDFAAVYERKAENRGETDPAGVGALETV